MAIVVVTHNGKSPAEGGIRLRYQVGNWYYDLRTRREYTLPAAKPKEKKVKAPEPVIDYYDLPVHYGYCVTCGSEKIIYKFVKTDMGFRRVSVCQICNRMMR